MRGGAEGGHPVIISKSGANCEMATKKHEKAEDP
jgi:hypothetical protein